MVVAISGHSPFPFQWAALLLKETHSWYFVDFMSPNCGLCVSSSDRRESNPRDFFKLALFFRAGKKWRSCLFGLREWDFQWEIEWGLLFGLQCKILGIFLKLHFFSRRERNPWRTAHNCGLCVSSDNARAQAEPYHIMSPIHQITILILEYEGSCMNI